MNRFTQWRAVLVLLATFTLAAGCSRPKAATPAADGEYAISVTDQGFEPAVVTVPAGRPVTLVITRRTDQTCATDVVFESLNQHYDLPLNQSVRIALPASPAETLSYECGMKMIEGRIVFK